MASYLTSSILNLFPAASQFLFEVPTRVPIQTIDEIEKAKLLENLVGRETCSRSTDPLYGARKAFKKFIVEVKKSDFCG